MLYRTGLHSSLLILVSRFFPLALSLIIAWWAQRRLGPSVLQPVPLVSLIATSLCLRLVFEINLWGYYFMAVAVSLVLLDVLNGRIRVALIVWLVAVTLVSQHVWVHTPSIAPKLYWQAILVTTALLLALSPLVSLSRREAAMNPHRTRAPRRFHNLRKVTK